VPSKLKAILLEDIEKAVRRYSVSEVVVSGAGENVNFKLYSELINLLEKGFLIREYTQVFEEITQKVPVEHMELDFYKYFPFSRSNKNRLYLFLNQIFNIGFALFCALITLLLIPFILLGNVFANRGPLLYGQDRIGLNGKKFRIIKFRTMIKNAEANGARWSQKGDVRITPFGKILRNTRLDELPQCLNILQGHMSLIGPRPERPEFVVKLSKKIPFYETRHIIKPGLTGWAQVRGRYAQSENDALEKLQYDLYYIKHRNAFLDLSILLKTCSTMIYYRGQ
ncbi:MAG: sugar transferase, partial [Leeuwenhoekiella sp.]